MLILFNLNFRNLSFLIDTYGVGLFDTFLTIFLVSIFIMLQQIFLFIFFFLKNIFKGIFFKKIKKSSLWINLSLIKEYSKKHFNVNNVDLEYIALLTIVLLFGFEFFYLIQAIILEDIILVKKEIEKGKLELIFICQEDTVTKVPDKEFMDYLKCLHQDYQNFSISSIKLNNFQSKAILVTAKSIEYCFPGYSKEFYYRTAVLLLKSRNFPPHKCVRPLWKYSRRCYKETRR